jgi:AcrR family transcriptional regulator
MSPSGMDDTTDAYPLTERIEARVGDPRAWSVMAAAYDVFLQYGVRRASMQDIADRAGMSRAALYLHYKNKADIFEALMGAYFATAAEAVAEALAAHADPSEALAAAFRAQVGDAAEGMLHSPHAEELLSAKQGAIGATQAEGYEGLVTIYADWLDRAADAGRVRPLGSDAREVAATLIAALDGLKSAPLDLAGYRLARDRLARMLGRGLSV